MAMTASRGFTPPAPGERDHVWRGLHGSCLRCGMTPEQMSADLSAHGYPTCAGTIDPGSDDLDQEGND